jgi:type II restriction/modification system DNA methylase subunit YeeA
MRKAFKGKHRYIGTPRNGKYRLFTWLDTSVLPDCQVVAVARSDDTTLGILHSRFHELWALRMCTWLGVGNDPRYTPTTTFETFPFPEGLTPNLEPTDYTNPAAAEIAAAAQALNKLRENWLNPPEWVDWVRTPEEEKAGYPARPVAKADGDVGRDSSRLVGLKSDLQKRTLTNLYNARPAWLDNAHKTLDSAVAKAYGWNDYTPEMPDEDILRRLLALNLARSKL